MEAIIEVLEFIPQAYGDQVRKFKVRKYYKCNDGMFSKRGKYGLSFKTGKWIRVPEGAQYPHETIQVCEVEK